MSADTNRHAAALKASLAKHRSEGGRLSDISGVLKELDLESYVGSIGLAGRDSVGNYQVDFNVLGGTGYGSSWPLWAYEVALSAFLHDKAVYVVSDGPPFGENLLVVLIMKGD